MALPTSPPISLNDIKAEFGATGSRSLTAFYRGGSFVPNIPANSGVPTSGSISLLDFLGASNLVMPTWGPGIVRTAATSPASASATVTLYSSTGGTIPAWNDTIRASGTPLGGMTTEGLDATWLPSGMNSSDFRVRFVELSRPAGTAYSITGSALDTWHSMSSNRSVTLTTSIAINIWLVLRMRVEIALAGTTDPVYSNTVALSVARTASGIPPSPEPEP